MSRQVISRSIVLALLGLANTAGTSSGQTTRSVEAEVLALDSAWIRAEIGADQAALEEILHEDFLATFASGRTIDRQEFIDRILRAPPPPFSVSHDVVRVYGDVAVVIDSSTDGATKFTWIAVRREGRWRVISETFTNVRNP